MKNIPLTESEIKEIREHYTTELDVIEKRAKEIRSILHKISEKLPLKVKEISSGTEVLLLKDTEIDKTVSKQKTDKKKSKKLVNGEDNILNNKQIKERSGNKKGRKVSADSKKSIYQNYLLGLLQHENRLLSSTEIFDKVEKQFNVSASDYSKMKATVTVILSKTKANGAIKDFIQKGIKSKFYGLTHWFDNYGNPKENYNLK